MTVAPDSGRPCSLLGRYFNTLVELDVDRARVRALEPAARERPGQRASAVVAAFTLPGPAGGSPPRSSVVCGFGYSTLDPARQVVYIYIYIYRVLHLGPGEAGCAPGRFAGQGPWAMSGAGCLFIARSRGAASALIAQVGSRGLSNDGHMT
jgi:hypothetical protein